MSSSTFFSAESKWGEPNIVQLRQSILPTINADNLKVRRTEQIVDVVKNMQLKHIRKIMALVCKPDITSDHLLLDFGMTLGEFSVAYMLKK